MDQLYTGQMDDRMMTAIILSQNGVNSEPTPHKLDFPQNNFDSITQMSRTSSSSDKETSRTFIVSGP
jgi:hypothetical protein